MNEQVQMLEKAAKLLAVLNKKIVFMGNLMGWMVSKS